MSKNTNSKRNMGKTPNTKRKGRKYDKEDSSASSNTRSSSTSYGGNDVSWYKHYPELTDAAARVPFAWQPGRQIPLSMKHFDREGSDWNEVSDKRFLYPGIMSLGFRPTVGRSVEISSPINIAAREVYGRIRAKYSGSLEADAPDIMMYMLAVDSLYMIYEDMKRAYYLINQYTPYNTLYPKAIIEALGYDFEDLMDNKVKLYQRIVEAGAMLSKFMVPDTMDLFKRHQFMCANVYADSPSGKSQHYVFRLHGYYRLKNVDTMTELEMRDYAEPGLPANTVDFAWQEFLDSISVLMDWDTSYTILGYLQRAYEGTAFLAPTPVVEDAILAPVYNEEVLLQIQNLTAVNLDRHSLDIVQKPDKDNMIVSMPKLKASSDANYSIYKLDAMIPSNALLSIPGTNQPTPEDIIIATRLTTVCAIKNANTGDDALYIDCGTEIVDDVYLYIDSDGKKTNVPKLTCFEVIQADPVNDESADIGKSFNTLSNIQFYTGLLSAFSRHPNIIYSIKNNETGGASLRIYCDADNVTVVENTVLTNLHRMCIYSEFNCFSN